MATGHPEGLLILKPAELAALTFVLAEEYPALAPGGHRSSASS